MYLFKLYNCFPGMEELLFPGKNIPSKNPFKSSSTICISAKSNLLPANTIWRSNSPIPAPSHGYWLDFNGLADYKPVQFGWVLRLFEG